MAGKKTKPIAVPITAADKLSAKFDKISSKIEKLRAPVNRLQKAFKRLDKATGLKTIGQGLKRVGQGLTRFVTLPLAIAGAAAVKFSTDLNEGIANVGTLIPGQIGRLKMFKSEIQDLAIRTGKSTIDLSAGLFDVISAFGDSEDSMKRLIVINRAAVSGQSTTKESLALLSAVTKAYGDTSVGTLKHVSDLAFKTNELGQTNFPEMAQAIRGVTSSSTAANVKMEDMFGVFAAATGVTGNASEVATQYNAALKALLIPSKEMKTVIKSLGFESAKTMIDQIGLKNTFLSLRKGAKANNFELEQLFGRFEGFKLVGALTGKVVKDFTFKMDAMKDVTGATDLAFKEITEGINKTGFQLKIFKQLVIVTGQKIGDILAPMLVGLLSKLLPLFKAFFNMNAGMRKVIIVAALVVAALGPLLIVVGSLITALGILGPAFIAGAAIIKTTVIPAVLKLSLALLTNPIFIVAAGIALVIGLLVRFTSLFDPIVDKIKRFFGFIGDKSEININGPEGKRGASPPGDFLNNIERSVEEKTINNNTRQTAAVEIDIKGAPAGTTVRQTKNEGVDLTTMKLGPVGGL